MIKAVVFDLGGVLLDWNPRYLYRDVIQDDTKMEYFLSHVCTDDWNLSLDKGRTWADARAEVTAKFPDYTDLIDMYWDRWLEMFEGPIHESVDILMDLKRRGYPLYALSNWNDVKFQVALQEFPFLRIFDGRIVSGDVKLVKPDPAIYKLLLDTYKLNPREIVFIDDRAINVEAAREQGIESIQFISPAQLESDLAGHGFFPDTDDSDDEPSEDVEGGCGGQCTCHGQ